MKAIIHDPQKTPRLFLGDVQRPIPKDDELLIKVAAAGVNRADVDQSKGEYPAPPGASPVLGLEVAGEVVAVGKDVTRFKSGMRVMSLLQGGGYAEYCTANEATSLPVPASLSFIEAAAIPEAYFTIWSNVFEAGQLKAGETLLVHGGTSGIGSTTIQLAKARGAKVIATARTPEKCEACRALGADHVVNYSQDDFAASIEKFTGGQGVDVIFDWIGSSYLERHLRILRRGGRLVLIDSRSGDIAKIDLGTIMVKKIVLTGSLLRPRPLSEKRAFTEAIERELLPPLASGKLRPLISHTFPFGEAHKAHELMESSGHIGKIVLVN